MTRTSPITSFYTHVAAANAAEAAKVLRGASLMTHHLNKLVPFGDALRHNDFDALPGLYFLDRIETIRRDRDNKDIPPESLDAVQQDLANLVMEAVPSALPHVARLILLSNRKMSPLFSSSDQILRQLRRMLSKVTISRPEDLGEQQCRRLSPALMECYKSHPDIQLPQEAPDQEKTMTIQLRVTDDELKGINKRAADMELTTTNLLRDKLGLPRAPYRRRKSLLRDSDHVSDDERRALTYWYENGVPCYHMSMKVEDYQRERTLMAGANLLYTLVGDIRELTTEPIGRGSRWIGTYHTERSCF